MVGIYDVWMVATAYDWYICCLVATFCGWCLWCLGGIYSVGGIYVVWVASMVSYAEMFIFYSILVISLVLDAVRARDIFSSHLYHQKSLSFNVNYIT